MLIDVWHVFITCHVCSGDTFHGPPLLLLLYHIIHRSSPCSHLFILAMQLIHIGVNLGVAMMLRYEHVHHVMACHVMSWPTACMTLNGNVLIRVTSYAHAHRSIASYYAEHTSSLVYVSKRCAAMCMHVASRADMLVHAHDMHLCMCHMSPTHAQSEQHLHDLPTVETTP